MPLGDVQIAVTILLSAFNGERFLAQQLASLTDQTHADWRLRWRDDGSTDATRTIVEAFALSLRPGRATALGDDGHHRGIAGSFLHMLRLHTETGSDDLVAFCDQDDLWLPEKLARGAAAFAGQDRSRPTLYCARQMLADARLRTLGPSPGLQRPPSFPAALVQNIATGCTVMLNRSAARLIASVDAPEGTLHDWWAYLVVAAAGGQILVDGVPVVLYRQHGANAVGATRSRLGRGASALLRGPKPFMSLLHRHVAALSAARERLPPVARERLDELQRALSAGFAGRMRALRALELVRQTAPETAIFRLWFLLG